MLIADDEESAEIYGAAKDTKQARKVWDVAYSMLRLSPALNKLWKAGTIVVNRQEKKIIYEPTGSYYEIVTADAEGELGHNPHGMVFDEVLSQPNDKLWNALRTSMGAREQPLMVAATTATNNPAGFAAAQHTQMERVLEDPSSSPHIFVFMRNMPRDADIWDERNWKWPNPALDDFLSRQALRDEAKEAREDPTKENSFRQFRGNQHVQQVTRWIPLHVWDQNLGLVVEDQLVGRRCFGGLDLSTTADLTALCWFFPGTKQPHEALWRFWVPEDVIPHLDRFTAGKASVWVREGVLRTTEGSVIDYDKVHRQIEQDAKKFDVQDIGIDRWNSAATVGKVEKAGINAVLVGQGYAGLSAPMKELMRLLKSQELNHGGNPVARWNADSVEVKQDDAENIKPVKPEREKSGKRIDGIVALVMAIDGWMRRGQVVKRRGVASF
jgi:phage terminase large subunit-like protein